MLDVRNLEALLLSETKLKGDVWEWFGNVHEVRFWVSERTNEERGGTSNEA